MPKNMISVIKNKDRAIHELQAENALLKEVAEKATSDLLVSNRTAHSNEYELIAAKSEIAEQQSIITDLGTCLKNRQTADLHGGNGARMYQMASELNLVKIELGSTRNQLTTEENHRKRLIVILKEENAALTENELKLMDAAEITEKELMLAKKKIEALEKVVQGIKAVQSPLSFVSNTAMTSEPSGEEAGFSIKTGANGDETAFSVKKCKTEADRARLFCKLRHQNGMKY